MENLFDLRDRVILITGGANGIGKGISLGLAALGGTVVVWDLKPADLEQCAGEAKAAGSSIVTESVDVTSESAVVAAMDRIVADHGRIDAVFVNAGVSGKAQPVEDYSLENWRLVHSVNLDGAFLTAREAARHMKTQKRGKIVFTASVWSERGAQGAPIAAYMSSKGAILNLTRQMALELAQYNITVNGIAPAGFLTSLGNGELDSSFGDWLVGQIAMHRMVEPSEMVGPAAFLASRASDWVTGSTLPVDGGFLAS
jgi:NAD(P)-dependent dehydrogenase (short-subunit alcohol dehydrogenase family)